MAEQHVGLLKTQYESTLNRLRLRVSELAATNSQLRLELQTQSAQCKTMLTDYRQAQATLEVELECSMVLRQEVALLEARLQQLHKDAELTLRRSHRKTLELSLHSAACAHDALAAGIDQDKRQYTDTEQSLQSALTQLTVEGASLDESIAVAEQRISAFRSAREAQRKALSRALSAVV